MVFQQAPWLPELYFLHHDAAAVDQMFSPGTAAGPCNPDAFKPEDIAWYRAAMQKPGAATALIDYYRCGACGVVQWVEGLLKAPRIMLL